MNLFRDGVAGAFFAVIAADLAAFFGFSGHTPKRHDDGFFRWLQKGNYGKLKKKEDKKFPYPDDKIILLKQMFEIQQP